MGWRLLCISTFDFIMLLAAGIKQGGKQLLKCDDHGWNDFGIVYIRIKDRINDSLLFPKRAPYVYSNHQHCLGNRHQLRETRSLSLAVLHYFQPFLAFCLAIQSGVGR